MDYARLETEMPGQRKNRLLDPGGDEVHRNAVLAQRPNRLFCSFDERRLILLAKLLDTLQNPFRRTYQELHYSNTTQSAKGPDAMFDNVTAIFSATPVIARTATRPRAILPST